MDHERLYYWKRQWEAEILPPSQETASALDELGMQRALFELALLRDARQPEGKPKPPCEQPRYTMDEAARFIEQIKPTLDKNYRWLASIDLTVLSQLMNEVETYRAEFVAEHGEVPPDSQIYRHYRLQCEGSDDAYTHQAILIIDALMNGDPRHGQLPDFH